MTTETIKNQRLQETVNEILGAIKTLRTDKSIKPKDYRDYAVIISNGERKVNKEITKRIIQVKELQAEIEFLNEFAEKMGYALESSESTDTETEEAEESKPEEVTA